MNKNLYRIVFNKARGLLMVVADIARSGRSGSSPSSGIGHTHTRLIGKVSALSFSLWLASGVVQFAHADIVADRNAPGNQQPTVLNSANGTPQINIQTPSAGGVSRNTYSQFDVNQQGAILNNSHNNVQTELGGLVSGNPWLARGEAKIILNEVNSRDASRLNGFVEVAGRKAEVVIANPAGITCNGCGFINANRATLTTGQAQLNNGNLTGFNVERGEVSVEGAGLDSSRQDYTDIIARSVKVNAGIWANDLKVTTGRNQVDAAHSSVTKQADDPTTRPQVSLDVSNLGGMYAGKIRMVGTETGLGVRNAGSIGAQAGSVVISADGQIENSGSIQSQSDVQIASKQGINNSGAVFAGSNAQINSAAEVQNSGSIASRNNVQLQAASLTSSKGAVLAAGVQQDGKLGNSGDLLLNTEGQLTAQGQNLAGGNLVARGQGVDVSSGQTLATNVTLDAGKGNLNTSQGQVNAEQQLTASSAQLHNNDGGKLAATKLSLTAHDLSNQQGQITQVGTDDLTLNHQGALNNRAGRIATNSNNLTVNADTLDNQSGEISHAGNGKLAITTRSLQGNSGKLLSAGQLNLRGGDYNLDAGTTSAQQIDLDTNSLSNRQGKLVQSGNANLRLHTHAGIDNQGGQLAANGNIDLKAAALNNQAGKVIAAQNGGLNAQVTGAIDNRQGQLAASGDVNVQSDALDNSQGLVSSATGNSTITSQQALTNQAGRIEAKQDIVLTSGGLENQSGQIIGDNLQLGFGNNAFNNQAGVIAASGNLSSTSGALNNDAGLLQAAGNLQLDTQGAALSNRLSGETGGILSQGTLTLRSGALDNSQGMLVGGGNSQLTTQGLNNSGGTLVGKQQLQIDSNGAFINDAGLLQSGADASINTHGYGLSNRNSGSKGGISSQGKLNITAGDIDNQQGFIASKGDLALQGTQLENQAGQLVTEQNLAATAATINNQDGTIKSGQGMVLNAAQQLDNSNKGVIGAGKTLQLTGGQVLNNQGTLVSGDAATINMSALDNRGGQLAAQKALALQGDSLNNDDGGLIQSGERLGINVNTLSNRNSGDKGGLTSQGDMAITAGNVDNSLGVTLAGQGLQLNAGQLNNASGKLIAQQQLAITTQSALNNQAGLLQGAGLQLDTNGQLIDNQNGTLYSLGDLALNSGDINNQAGTLGSKGDLNLQAGNLDNSNSGRVVSEKSATLQTANLNNQAGQIQSVGDLLLNSVQGVIDNTSGLIRSGATATLTALHLNNQDTQAAQQGIEAQNVSINSSSLSNQRGSLLAEKQLSLTTNGQLDNSSGQLSAGETLSLQGNGLALTNTAGVLKAGKLLAINAAQIGGDGQLLSLGDINLVSQQGINNSGEMIANGNFNFTTAGDVANSNKLVAGGKLDLHANNLFNAASGEINAGQDWLTVNGALTNYGLIDGKHTLLNANTLNNIGTGRIYGDAIGVQTVTFNNLKENGTAATLAGRERVDIGTQTLNNRDHALIYSGGDMAIGGQLDANSLATGKAAVINNHSATIESAGNMLLSVAQINNVNDHFVTELVTVSNEDLTEYQQSGDPVRWKAEQQGVFVDRNSADGLLNLNTPGKTGHGNDRFTEFDYHRTVQETQITESDPAKILAGGNMTLSIDGLFNDRSQVIAGGTLAMGTTNINNTQVPGQSITTDVGKVTNYYRIKKKGKDNQGRDTAAYTPPAAIQTIMLKASQLIDHGQVSGNPIAIAPQGVQGTDATINNAGGVSATVAGSLLAPALQTISTGAVPTINAAVLQPGQQFEVKSTVTQQQGENASVVRIVGPNTQLPDNSLFKTNPAPNGQYLVETDPRFTNMKQWLGSDYMQNALQGNSDNTLKRLGDGYYEQRLIREQVVNLTGQRYLDGYSSDEEQFKALMDQGIAFSKTYNLKLGVALTPEQMGLLTKDIVWLVNAQAKLPDGSTQTVLVPQVYARMQPGDLDGSGALIAGRNLDLNLGGSLFNSGTIAGREVVKLSADNINNMAGTIQGADVSLNARTDINNIGGVIKGTDALLANAGRDINAVSTTRSAQSVNGANSFERTTIDAVAGMYVQGDDGKLVLHAGRDIKLDAAQVINTGKNGQTLLDAGRDINLNTLTTASRDNIVWDGDNSLKQSNTRQVGSEVSGKGNVTLNAGHDINATGVTLASDSALKLAATQDVNIKGVLNDDQLDERHKVTGGNGWLSKTTTTTRDTVDRQTVQGSSISAGAVGITAGNNITVAGSSVAGTGNVALVAGNDLTITHMNGRNDETHLKQEKQSGFMSAGGLGFTVGSRKETTDEANQAQNGQGSMVGSLQGDTVLVAKNDYRQTGSTVSAPTGNVLIQGKNVTIEAADNTYASQYKHSVEQKGFTLAVNVPVVQAVRTAVGAVQQVGKSKDDRINMLAAANAVSDSVRAANTMMNTAKGLMEDGSSAVTQNVSVSLTYGQSKQTNTEESEGNRALGSKVNAGKNAVVIATGGEHSDINVIGSDISGKQGTQLIADHDVNIIAAKQERTTHSDNQSSGWNAGIAASYGQGGASFGITAGANKGQGSGKGEDVSWLNSHVGDMDSKTTITSGGTTRLSGGQLLGKGVEINADNLIIESLQDTMKYKAKQQEMGGQITVGYGVSGSANFSQSKVNSDYASVQEQSGIFAGDEGYNINVKNNTDLKGGLITSNEIAERLGNNAFSTGTLSWSDIQNHANYSGNAIGLSGSAGMNFDTGLGSHAAPQSNKTVKDDQQNIHLATGSNSLQKDMSFGLGHDSGKESSVTRSGINTSNIQITNGDAQLQQSGKTVAETLAAIKTDISTENAAANSGKLTNNFDKDQVFKELNLQVKVTQEFKQNASAQIHEYIDDKQAAARKEMKAAMDSGDTAKRDEALAEIYKLQYQRRFLETLVGVVAGSPGAAITQGTLVQAATLMREETIRNSMLFPGVVDSTGRVISNVSGDSVGLYDGIKAGGVRVGLDSICGKDNGLCQTDPNDTKDIKDLLLDEKGRVTYIGQKGRWTFTELFNEDPLTEQNKKDREKNKELIKGLYGPTGGSQINGGLMAGHPYSPGSFFDNLVESFAGTHDLVGGELPGFYDSLGNTSRNRAPWVGPTAEVWTIAAIPLAAPFALSEFVSPELLQFIFATSH